MINKIVILFICAPMFLFSQDAPLVNEKITTSEMIESDQKERNKKNKKLKREISKSKRIYARSQIAYLFNPNCPFGFNYFGFFSDNIGWYFDYRNDFGLSSGLESQGDVWASYDREFIEGLNYVKTGYQAPGGYWVFDVGLAFSLVRTKNTAWICYAGFGQSTEKLYDEYTSSYTSNTADYVRNGGNVYGNINFGILRQGDIFAWQLGFDSAVAGFTIGLGFPWL